MSADAASTVAIVVNGLTVSLRSGPPVVEGVSLSVHRGEVLGLVGESGSGKTTTALAMLGYTRPGLKITDGQVVVGGNSIDLRDERRARALRGRVVSYVPQDPANALNPALRIRGMIEDMLTAAQARRGTETVARALAAVSLPGTREFARRFPHQLSGGQQQRVAIAMALAGESPCVILDEPTTGLDVITQAQVLDEVARLQRERGLAIVYVSHDLAVVAQIADRICVMYAGRVVEEGPAAEVLQRPRHPYAGGLVASIPDHRRARTLRAMPGVAPGIGERPAGCSFAPRCPQRVERCEQSVPKLELVDPAHSVRCFEWQRTALVETSPPVHPAIPRGAAPLLAVESLRAGYANRHERTVVADDVTFALAAGECLAIVGESGSGKTTIARCVAGLHEPDGGRILLDGTALAAWARDRPKELRRRIQIVFQNPYDSLNPRHRIAQAIARPARILRGLSAAEATTEAHLLLERVRLPKRLAQRFPPELSGGERQRAAIARALAARPDLLVCDEITSALDVSVQAAVFELLAELRADLDLSLLFITHDLGVVASVADRVVVLDHGRICEAGAVADVLARPSHAYTRRLIEAAPSVTDGNSAASAL